MSNNTNGKMVFGEVDPKTINGGNVNMNQKVTIEINQNAARVLNAVSAGISALTYVGREIVAGASGIVGDAIEKAPDVIANTTEKVASFKSNIYVAMAKAESQRLQKALESGNISAAMKIQFKQQFRELQDQMKLNQQKAVLDAFNNMYGNKDK